MPIYKNMPHSKSKPLPFYRPIDRLMIWALERRKALTPFLAAAAVVLAIFAGMKGYSGYYETKATEMSNRGDLEGVVKDYSRSEAAGLARIRLGKRALEAKDYDQAIRWYTPLAEDHAAPTVLRIGAIQNMALAYLKKGNGPKAIELLEKASRERENSNGDYSQLLLARSLEVNGQKDRARDIYKNLSEGAAKTGIGEEAKERLSWIESKEPKSATP